MATSVPFDTERFHLALQLRQETKAGLGSALGVSRQFVHQIATGTRTPTREFVLGLARHLAVSPRFFEEALPDKLAEHMTHFRALKSTSKRRRDSAKAYAQILDLLVAQVIDRVEVPPVDIPSYVANTVADAERAAEGARRYWDLTVNGPIASVVRVLEHAGAITTALYGLATKIDAFSCQGLTRPLVVVVGDRGTATRSWVRRRSPRAPRPGESD